MIRVTQEAWVRINAERDAAVEIVGRLREWLDDRDARTSEASADADEYVAFAREQGQKRSGLDFYEGWMMCHASVEDVLDPPTQAVAMVRRLREALAWYADPSTWQAVLETATSGPGALVVSTVTGSACPADRDHGDRARAALAAPPAVEEEEMI